MKNVPRLIAVFAMLILAYINHANAQGTAFTYQGRLQDNGNPASGIYNFTFSLFSTNTNGTAIAGPMTNSGVTVSNGLFTATVDFGSNVFTGTMNWLQIGVGTNGSTNFITLAPRQQLTPVPYAIYASNGGGSTPAGAGYVFAGIGSPVGVLTPTAPTAVYFDNSVPGQPGMWEWANSTWTQVIGN